LAGRNDATSTPDFFIAKSAKGFDEAISFFHSANDAKNTPEVGRPLAVAGHTGADTPPMSS
jgi:hypothetical protein